MQERKDTHRDNRMSDVIRHSQRPTQTDLKLSVTIQTYFLWCYMYDVLPTCIIKAEYSNDVGIMRDLIHRSNACQCALINDPLGGSEIEHNYSNRIFFVAMTVFNTWISLVLRRRRNYA